jgi:hypothetical protein
MKSRRVGSGDVVLATGFTFENGRAGSQEISHATPGIMGGPSNARVKY